MNYESIINQAKETKYKQLSKEEYAQVKKQKRNECFSIANEKLLETVKTPEAFLHYLKVQSKMSQTPTNVMIALAHFDNPVEMHDLDTWSRNFKRQIYASKGSKSFSILEPVPYTNKDGEQAIAYNPKCVFEYSQLNNPPKLPKVKHLSLDTLLRAMITNNKINVVSVDFKESSPTVHYNEETKVMEIMKGSELSEDEMKHELLYEYCYANLLEAYQMRPENTKLLCECSAFMLATKYNIPANTEFVNDAPTYFKGCNEDQIRTALNISKDVTDDMTDCIARQLMKENLTKESKSQDVR